MDLGPITQEQWAKHRREATQSLPAVLEGMGMLDILLPSQKALLLATASNQVTVADKSRRIGFTWAVGADAVLTSGAAKTAGGMDTLYIGYNLDMAREFIDTCAMWAKAFMPAVTEVGEFLFVDQVEGKADRHIQAFRIGFASGYEIVALSSRPRSLRGRQGYVILDEFAFHDDPDGLLKAAMALLIWGGKVLVISTHNGEENPFNELIKDILSKKKPGAVVRCTFDDALEQGLYQRICLVRGIEWSPEGEAKWRAEIRGNYGSHAAEELDCVPSQGSGVYFTRAMIEACATAGGEERILRLTVPKEFELQSEASRRSYVDAWLEQTVLPHIKALDKNLRHGFGQDFAMTGDVSAIVPMCIERNLDRRVPFVVEMRRVPYAQQKQILFWIVENLPRFSGGKLDATGNGAPLAQETMQKFGKSLIEEVKLSQEWYRVNMPPLKSAYEDRTFAEPKHVDLVDDMRQVRLVKGIPLIAKDQHTKGSDGEQRHGDTAVAKVLAFAALGEPANEYGYTPVPKDQPKTSNDADEDDDLADFGSSSLGAQLRRAGAL